MRCNLQVGLVTSHFCSFPFLLLRRRPPEFPLMANPPIQSMSASTKSMKKRPTCPSCSRPIRICLCNRLPTPVLHNSLSLTILQHTLEKNHPLNSARIATIAFQNLHLLSVTDVHLHARFSIRLLPEIQDNPPLVFDEMPCVDFLVGKHGAVTSAVEFRIGTDQCQRMSFDQLLASDLAAKVLRKGFVVKKVVVGSGSDEYDETQEFEVTVPPGSALLFPSESSIDVANVNFEVKNLIVLDGTWAKAKRMYSENPWLKLLPHLSLSSHKPSLYSEVRHQPKAGYLSTIESIVYAMKAVGKECEGLDGLLDVFESMVGDQSRCKNERLSKLENK